MTTDELEGRLQGIADTYVENVMLMRNHSEPLQVVATMAQELVVSTILLLTERKEEAIWNN